MQSTECRMQKIQAEREEKLKGRKRPDVIKNVPVRATVRFINDKPVVVETECVDIPVEVWDAFWQKAYRDSVRMQNA